MNKQHQTILIVGVGLALALGYVLAGGAWWAAGAALLVVAVLAVCQRVTYRPPFPVGVIVSRSHMALTRMAWLLGCAVMLAMMVIGR